MTTGEQMRIYCELQVSITREIGLALALLDAKRNCMKLAAELGVPAAVLLFSLLYWLAGRILRASRSARSRLARAIALGSLGGVGALLVHSIADFNLYIPANALVFAVILGLGYAVSLDESASDAAVQTELVGEASLRRPVSVRSADAPEENEVEAGVRGSRSS